MEDKVTLQPTVKVKITKYLEGSNEPYEIEEHELTKEEADAIWHSLQQE